MRIAVPAIRPTVSDQCAYSTSLVVLHPFLTFYGKIFDEQLIDINVVALPVHA
jgi:hypothetical protein